MTAAASSGAQPLGAYTAPAPQRPSRIQWSLVLIAFSCVAMFAGLVLSIAGVPAKLTYNPDGPGVQNHYTGNDPMKTMSSIDGNLKYVREQSGYDAGQLNAYFKSIDQSEDNIPIMARSVQDMTSSVIAIDDSLKDVKDVTLKMKGDMTAMAATSSSSAETMAGLNADIQSLGGQMGGLYTATAQLVANLDKIHGAAKQIADKRTSAARKNTHKLNSVLPSSLPKPNTTLYPQGQQAGIQ